MEPTPIRPQQVAATGLANITKNPSGTVDGYCYVAIANQPQGHLEIHAPSVDAVKFLMQTLGQWVAQNEDRIIKPGVVS